MPVNHLVRQVEIFRSEQSDRGLRPEWVTALINDAVELFDPVADVARAGFECRAEDGLWSVEIYLGGTEVVGGSDDGRTHYSAFQFDVGALLALFDETERIEWRVYPESAVSTDNGEVVPASFLTIQGTYGGHAVRLQIDSIPPANAGPGFLAHADGTCTPA